MSRVNHAHKSKGHSQVIAALEGTVVWLKLSIYSSIRILVVRRMRILVLDLPFVFSSSSHKEDEFSGGRRRGGLDDVLDGFLSQSRESHGHETIPGQDHTRLFVFVFGRYFFDQSTSMLFYFLVNLSFQRGHALRESHDFRTQCFVI